MGLKIHIQFMMVKMYRQKLNETSPEGILNSIFSLYIFSLFFLLFFSKNLRNTDYVKEMDPRVSKFIVIHIQTTEVFLIAEFLHKTS